MENETKEKAKAALNKIGTEVNESYDSILAKLAKDRKTSLGYSRIFVAGAISGAAFASLVFWLFF